MNVHDNRAAVARTGAWWTRADPAPLVECFVPLAGPPPPLDLQIPVEELGERKQALARREAMVAQDLPVVQRVDFGPAFLPALAGAGFESDGGTSWNHPIAERCRDLRIPAFNPDQPLWISYHQRREALHAAWSWDGFLPGHTNNIGPLDIVAALLGPENLALELLDDPQGVAEVAAQAADLFRAVMRDEVAALRQAGLEGGTIDTFRIWMPGDGTRLTEDVATLVGPEVVRDLFTPADRRAVAGFDRVLYHTHSAAWRCLPQLVDLGLPVGVEIGTDPGEPGLETRLATAHALQERGLPVQYGSWRHPLTDAEIDRVLDVLSPRGLILRFQASSAEDARRIHERIRTQPAKESP